MSGLGQGSRSLSEVLQAHNPDSAQDKPAATESLGNPEQQKAITHGAGPMMVLAGPGSGKTFVLTRRIAHLINAHHVAPSEILVITFTKAAAWEMQKRFLSLCEGTHPPVTFGTFHAVFYSILKETSICRAGSILSEQEKRKLLRDIIQRNKYNVSLHTDMIDEILAKIGQFKNLGSGINVEHAAIDSISQTIDPKLLQTIYRDFMETQEILGKVDFDDMALKCEELFLKRPDILRHYQQKYRYLLIDEFQDIAPLQYRLVKQLAAPENNLFIVGDDDQSIYGFRGAKPDIMLNFPKDYLDTITVTLQMNYRSTVQIVETAKKLIAHNKNRFPKESRAAGEEGMPVRVEGYENSEAMECALMAHLLQEKEAGNLSACAIISRTSGIFPVLAEKYRQAGIPCHFKENIKSIYDSDIVHDLFAYLEFSKMPLKDRSRSLFFQFMNRPLRYISREAVNETADFNYMLRYYQGRTAMQEEIKRFRQDLERIASMPVFLAVNYIRKAMKYDSYLAEKSEKREHIMREADLIQNSARECRTLEQWKEKIEALRKESMPEKKEGGEQEGVTLITMHSSKGLEYEKVFMINCNEEVTPHKKAVKDEEIEEERRMFFVGMTRAKKELMLLYITGEKSAKNEGKAVMPSRFLGETDYMSSSNSQLSKYSSKASAAHSYSSSSSI